MLNPCRTLARLHASHPRGDAGTAWGDVRALGAELVTGYLLAGFAGALSHGGVSAPRGRQDATPAALRS